MIRKPSLYLLAATAVYGLSWATSFPTFAQVAAPVREDAMNNPHKHAWDLFLALNHPAKDPKVERGAPDTGKKVGDPGLTVWETWKHARTEVFLEDGSKPKPWADLSGEGAPTSFKLFDVPKPVILLNLSRGATSTTLKALTKSNMRIQSVDPGDGLFDPNNFRAAAKPE